MALHKTAIVIILVSLAVAERVFLDLGPNIELVTLVSLLAAIWLGRKAAIVVALASLIISDLLIGNRNIFLFTWSGFAVIGWAAWLVTRFSGLKQTLVGGVFGLTSAVWFYLWTNFGVWLIGNLYPATFSGLIQSYYMGLPFLKLQAVSNMLILPGALTAVSLAANLKKEFLTIKA